MRKKVIFHYKEQFQLLDISLFVFSLFEMEMIDSPATFCLLCRALDADTARLTDSGANGGADGNAASSIIAKKSIRNFLSAGFLTLFTLDLLR